MSFYVYQLVDPRDGLPFYVGKGQGRRAWQHQKQVESGVVGGTSRKVDRIREILMSGHEVEVRILADYDNEEDALDHEWRLVNSTPTLTNIAEGGAGGKTLTPEQREKRRWLREERLSAARAKAREIAMAARVARLVKQNAGGKKTQHHADAVREWAQSIKDKRMKLKVKSKPDDGLSHSQRRLQRLQKRADAMFKG